MPLRPRSTARLRIALPAFLPGILPALLLACTLAPAAVAQAEREQPVRLSWELPEEPLLAGVPFALGLRVEVDAGFREASMVQPFRRELDLPVQLHAPWLERAEGLRYLDALGTDAGPTLAVNDSVVAGEQVPGAADALVVRVVRTAVVEVPGTVSLRGPRLTYASATSFRDDVFAGRVPEDREDHELVGEARQLVVEGFPEAGRPPGFVDAVGTFSVRASVEDATLGPGQELTLTLAIEGEGNLTTLTPPRLDALAGWHLQGVGERRDARGVVVVATLSPRNARVRAVPAIEFAWYEPDAEGGRYRVESTEPIPVKLEAPTVLPDSPGADATDDSRGGTRSEGLPLLDPLVAAALLGLAGLLVAGVALSVLRRRRRAAPAKPPARMRLAAALDSLRVRLDEHPAEPERALHAYLAGVLDCSEAAVATHDLEARLRAAGLSPALADEASRMLARLDARRFGAQPDAGESDEAEAVADLARRAQAELTAA